MTPGLDDARRILVGARSAAVFSGAGLSAESGIATFRGGGDPDALWSKFDPLELASVDGFRANRERVIAWYNWRRAKLATAEPNAAHRALAQQPPALVEITQNVDDLLERAGVAASSVLHLHGTIGKDRCNAARCGYEEAVDLAAGPSLRPCPRCGGDLRPAVVWFGEALPPRTWDEAHRICSAVDCLIVVGTSASVYPAAGLIDIATSAGAAVISVNTERSGLVGRKHVELVGPASVVLPALLDGLSLAT